MNKPERGAHWIDLHAESTVALLRAPTGARAAQRIVLLSLTQQLLPPVVHSALSVLRRYIDGQAEHWELEAARESLWASIDGRLFDYGDRDVCATRAALCALYPPGDDDDVLMALDFFLEMWDRFASDPQACVAAIRRVRANA
jgi:hypothetical protein